MKEKSWRIYFNEFLTRNCCWWLIVDSNFEPSWAPVNKLDTAFGFDGCYGSVDILGNHVTAVEKAARHVFAVAGIALDHLVRGFEAGVSDLRDSKLLMVRLLR